MYDLTYYPILFFILSKKLAISSRNSFLIAYNLLNLLCAVLYVFDLNVNNILSIIFLSSFISFFGFSHFSFFYCLFAFSNLLFFHCLFVFFLSFLDILPFFPLYFACNSSNSFSNSGIFFFFCFFYFSFKS